MKGGLLVVICAVLIPYASISLGANDTEKGKSLQEPPEEVKVIMEKMKNDTKKEKIKKHELSVLKGKPEVIKID